MTIGELLAEAFGRVHGVVLGAVRGLSEEELAFRPDAKVHDGRYANNGWLQEMPEPLTKLTWDNALCMAPTTARELGIAHGDVVALTAGEASVEIPAFVLPGQAPGSLALALGYGREAALMLLEGAVRCE